jgi:hypothetical protein
MAIMQRLAAALAVSSLAILCASGSAGGQPTSAPPFAVGERLVFVVSTVQSSKIGDAVMMLVGPVDVRGTLAVVSSFKTHIRVAMMKASNESESWFDARDMTSFRFTKREHRPFSSQNDSVEIFPDRHRWESAHDVSGTVSSDHPLDELSFIYFLRTVMFKPDSIYSFARHYDVRRSPTTVRVVKRETLQTRAGTFETTELEMRVKDGAEYKGDGVLHIWISDDPCRLPVRIESVMPVLGIGILSLDSAVTPFCGSGDPEKPRIPFRDS